MTAVEQGMCTFIGIFNKYAGKEGNKFRLSKAELKTLVETELPGFLENSKDKNALDKLMKDLDHNGDGEVDFTEYMTCMAAITCLCHEFFEKMPPKK
ncbi:protein S100-P-like [Ambystoma mexicanum]|uniref:protein S100-P-like n=1 Tax=Ambystoma mexicanum TaxID=8296 RepID=UPI0037E82B1C